jgi:hypothetical protein
MYIKTEMRGSDDIITKVFNDNHKLHCENGPAVYTSTVKEWFINGKRHRVDGPAILIVKDNFIRAEWWVNNVLHRDNKPAVIDSEGNVEYWKHGIKL